MIGAWLLVIDDSTVKIENLYDIKNEMVSL